MIPRRPRPSRLAAVPAVLALGLAAAGPVAPAQATSSVDCAARVRAAAAKTDAGGTFVRVGRSSAVEVYAPKGAGFGAYHYVCRRKDGVLHPFARNTSGASSGPDLVTGSFRTRGSDVAYRTTAFDTTVTDRFVVIDGRTGKVLRDTGRIQSQEKGGTRDDQLVLLSGARIGWGTRALGVHVLDADGDHVLAPASDGEPTRLHATAKTLAWTAGGTSRHAPLPGVRGVWDRRRTAGRTVPDV